MVLKVIDATEAKPGATILVDNEACTVRSNDLSKTGKHGAAKCRIEAIAIISGKKKILAVPGSERFDVPLITKHRAQVLTVNTEANTASIMDLESFETLELPVVEGAREGIAPEKQVEYWNVEGERVIMRVL